ncbi:uncharacterized protein LOC132696198 [Cylas formicarius]|uniref:uncharacterized protein LOC132696198 n=1 Tax=Cylas formicarius TaxID=197179 RepID=UPI002958367A|nr:uncharacterized protein LOC132696198 [Cylas formicarius]
MRRLARLLISVRTLKNNKTLGLAEILLPKMFKILVLATRNIAEYDVENRSFKSPSLALQMGTLIKHAVNTACSIEIQKENPRKNYIENFKELIKLIDNDWAIEVSSEAGQNLAYKKFNKPTLIPVAEDIKKLDQYLKNLISQAKLVLAENDHNEKAYRDLLEGIFCSVMIFNKRRVGELQRMTLLAFLENHDSVPSSEFEKVLTNSEKILFKSLKRIVIRGKRGRGVPVIFEKIAMDSTLSLVNLRKNFDLENNQYLFGLPGTLNPIGGHTVMRKHSLLALGGNKAAGSLLTSTRLRKQLATITQIFKMDKNELEQLASFMGHNEKTHSEFYRLPDDVYQTAKVSKLLLLSQNSALFEKNKGKPLSEIELNDEIIDESDDNYLEDIYENVLENQNPNQLKNQDQVPAFGVADIPREKKRKPWFYHRQYAEESCGVQS